MFDGALKVSWTFSTVCPMPQGVQGLQPACPRERPLYAEVI